MGNAEYMGKVLDRLRSSPNYLAGKVLNYLLQKSRFEDCKEFIEIISADNPIYNHYIAKAYCEIEAYKEAVLWSSTQLKVKPESSILLYYQAKGMLELKLYEYGLTLAKYSCELNPESTLSWVLLAKAYAAVGNYKYAMITIDTAPVYDNEILHDHIDKPIRTNPTTNPRVRTSLEYYSRIIPRPVDIDFEITSIAQQLETKTLNKREDDDQYSLISQLGANGFSQSEKEVYEVLSLIEKNVGWDALISIRDQLFIKGEGNDWDNPKIAAECPKKEKKSEIPLHLSLFYFISHLGTSLRILHKNHLLIELGE
eukprot:TRINITY_DN9855_c0_g2_i1.p1 TRINITY_DN9855_c0_g2~~TRINITY_DN9855_c0_g2_i1.p1  ORF type:complete len:312 (-),score=39.87 TRINITY_DN9855_c0_g2_i1:100-1035(-)